MTKRERTSTEIQREIDKLRAQLASIDEYNYVAEECCIDAIKSWTYDLHRALEREGSEHVADQAMLG